MTHTMLWQTTMLHEVLVMLTAPGALQGAPHIEHQLTKERGRHDPVCPQPDRAWCKPAKQYQSGGEEPSEGGDAGLHK